MCEKGTDPSPLGYDTRKEFGNQAQDMPRKPHMVYELEQKRDYHIRQLVDIQKAIDAVSVVSSLY